MYDLIVIGSGPAGEKGAAQAAYFGKSVALVERAPVLGGAGVNTGTVPSKTLRESALHISGFHQRGFRSGTVEMRIAKDVTVAEFMHRKNVVVEREWKRIEDNLRRHLVDRYAGVARFQSANHIEVTNAEASVILEGNVILIATGSSPHRPESV
ncbi:MAG TPA: FAD-dependent oxidoreductase, partial [Thermoanaerobaculia bacterium]|nr:FAD-dependent oxidoreductase [Thermoanaerobaculia bacterium]